MFVDAQYHQKGIAKKLWECVKTHFNVSNMTVNSSLYAVKIYESLGFIKNDIQNEFLNLKYQPMIYNQ